MKLTKTLSLLCSATVVLSLSACATAAVQAQGGQGRPPAATHERPDPGERRPASDLAASRVAPKSGTTDLPVVARDGGAQKGVDLVLFEMQSGETCLSPLGQEGSPVDCGIGKPETDRDELFIAVVGASADSPARVWGAAPPQAAAMRVVHADGSTTDHDVFVSRERGRRFFVFELALAERKTIQAVDRQGRVLASVERGGQPLLVPSTEVAPQ